MGKNLGKFAISTELLAYIRKTLPNGGTILELGSGKGTEALAEHYNMISVEHNLKFVGLYSSRYIHAPLTPCVIKKFPKQKTWYCRDVLRRELPKKGTYDLILVDGPPGSHGRAGFYKYVRDLFDTSVPIIMDDLHRAAEKEIIIKVAAKLERPFTTYIYPSGHFGIVHPPGVSP